MDENATSVFDLPTQSLFDPGRDDDLPEVDKLFSQVPLPEDFELTSIVTEMPPSSSSEVSSRHLEFEPTISPEIATETPTSS